MVHDASGTLTGQLTCQAFYSRFVFPYAMPEKGWSNITVREKTAKALKQIAKSQQLTIDEMLNHFLISVCVPRTSSAPEWIICHLCGIRLKTKNLSDHMLKTHSSTRRL